MKHLLNNLNDSERNRILEQYNNSLIVETKKFRTLVTSKLGNVKTLLSEQETQSTESTDPFDDPNHPIYQVGQTLIEYGFTLTQRGQGNDRSLTYTRQRDNSNVKLGTVPQNTQYSKKPYTISINGGQPTYFGTYKDIGLLLPTLDSDIKTGMGNPDK